MFAPRDPDEYLLETERRVIRVRRHWTSLMWDIVETIGLLAGAVVISMLVPHNALVQNLLWYAALFVVLRFAYTVVEWWVERLVVTDKRFLICRGVFTTQVGMMPITKVTDLTYQRSLMGRLLGYGTLVVESAGQIQGLDRIDHLPQPERVYDAISELVFGDAKARQERFSMLKARRAALGKRPVR